MPGFALESSLVGTSSWTLISHRQDQSLPCPPWLGLHLVLASLAMLFKSMSQGISENEFLPGGLTGTYSLSTQDTEARKFTVQGQHRKNVKTLSRKEEAEELLSALLLLLLLFLVSDLSPYPSHSSGTFLVSRRD